DAHTQIGSKARPLRIVIVKEILFVGQGKERLSQIFGILLRDIPLEANVFASGHPVRLNDASHRPLPLSRIGACDGIKSRSSRNRERHKRGPFTSSRLSVPEQPIAN